MTKRKRHPLIRAAGVTSLGTFASRILGLLRDVATAAVLGMSGGGVMDAFVVAFRIPNLMRRLFGEGALAASYLPVVSAKLQTDPTDAWRLTSVVFFWLALLMTALVALGEVALGLAWLWWGDDPSVTLLLGLAAVMAPYALTICLAAQVSATLHALGRFGLPSLVPTVLNVCWLVGLLTVAPHFESEQAKAYVVAVSILIAGFLQLGFQLPLLRRLGFRYDYNWERARSGVRKIAFAMGPMTLGLMITQINTLLDSLIAWSLAGQAGQPIAWLGGGVHYPMQQGAAAAIYYGERLYQFPLGVVGIAVATAIFPLLSRHAARGDRRRLAADLTLGLRLVLFLGVPAAAGLVVLAQPLAQLLFERGRFTPEDTARCARMIACYGLGVWAFCGLPVLVRGYYALDDRRTPLLAGTLAVALNLTLNLTLIWPLAEAGLAVATSVSATLQVLLLAALFSRRGSPLDWSALAATAARAVVGAALMAAVCWATLRWTPSADRETVDRLLRVIVPLSAALLVYFSVSWLLAPGELRLLLGGEQDDEL